MRLVLAFLAGSSILLTSGLQAAEEPRWRLEEVLSIGGPKSDLLSMWVGLAVDTEGFIYLSDNVQYSLMKFDPQGKLVKKTGRRGSRPGEFLAPRQVDVSGQSVYVTDGKIPAIQVFDKELKYQRRISLSYAVIEFQALPDNSLAVPGAPLLKSDAGKVIILDQTGRRLRSMAFLQSAKTDATSVAYFIFAPGGELYAAFPWADRIVKVDAQGRPVWSKSFFDPAKIKASRKTFFGASPNMTFKDIALDPKGRVFVLGGSFSQYPNRDVYVLNSDDGRLLETLTLPESSHCIYIDRWGYLYGRADMGSTLKKFKIIVPEERH